MKVVKTSSFVMATRMPHGYTSNLLPGEMEGYKDGDVTFWFPLFVLEATGGEGCSNCWGTIEWEPVFDMSKAGELEIMLQGCKVGYKASMVVHTFHSCAFDGIMFVGVKPSLVKQVATAFKVQPTTHDPDTSREKAFRYDCNPRFEGVFHGFSQLKAEAERTMKINAYSEEADGELYEDSDDWWQRQIKLKQPDPRSRKWDGD